jgi:phospholipase/carboxylesterase
MTDDRINAPPSVEVSSATTLVETRFIPRQYEPNYAYPLLVLFHPRGGDEDQLVRAMPALSWRNYVGLGLRGPESVIKRDGLAGFGWGKEFGLHERCTHRRKVEPSASELVGRALFHPDQDDLGRFEEAVFAAIRKTRSLLHVHSERIFLVGCGEGAAVAYRLGLTFPERFAGVVAINGWIPPSFRPLARMKACRDLPVLAVHGAWNAKHPLEYARREVNALRAGGLRVAFQSYPCNHRLNPHMLRDVDCWLMNHCISQPAV